MDDQGVPISALQLPRDMSGHVVIHFCEILVYNLSIDRNLYVHVYGLLLTDTKKLDVPSARSNASGNNFNQVSSPYITNVPSFLIFICASQVSWLASVAVVSDSAKFKITSRKDGMEPVVMALTRGMVIVGDVA